MSQPDITTHQTQGEKKNMSLLIRGSLWIAIGALIAAALVCVIWVLIGDQDGLIGRAFLTILLLAAFAGIAILEAGLAPNRPDWLQLASMVSWIIALLVGAVKIWLPEDGFYFGAERFFQLLLVIGILQLALLHVRLFTPRRGDTSQHSRGSSTSSPSRSSLASSACSCSSWPSRTRSTTASSTGASWSR